MDKTDLQRPGVSSDHLRAMADALPCMMFEADAQGANVWSNEAWQRYTGLGRAELAGRGWQRVLHPDDMAQDCADWARAVESASEYRVRQRLRRFDGQWRWNLVSAAPLRDALGNIQGWAGTITDIDDIVRGEASLLEQARLARFGLQLNDELRELTGARAMMEAATAALGQYLGVAQVGYGEIDEAQDHLTVHRDWHDGRIPSVVGTWRMDDFGPAFVQDIKAGRTAAIADVTRDARTSAPEVTAAYAAIGVRSILVVPLVRQGRLLALLFIHHPEPRVWTRAETALVEAVCSRLWSAVERARAERSLAELTATLDLAAVFVRSPSGTILHWSKGCERLYGWTAQEAAGRSAHELLRTVFPVPLSEIQAALERHGEWTGELRHTARDGRKLVVAARKALRRDGQGHPVAVAEAVTDVTAAWEATAALERSNAVARTNAERLQLALDAGAIIGTWVWGLATDELTADERFASTFGIDPALDPAKLALEQLLGSVHPEDGPGLDSAIREAIRRGGPCSHEFRVRGRDGVFHWIEANGRVELAADGRPLRFPGVLLSVERRRDLEAERDRALELLRAFADAVPGVVYAKDREGRMLVANQGVTALIGKPPQDYLGKTDLEFLDDKAQAAAVMANDRRVMDSGVAEQLEEAVSYPDGTATVWLSTKAPFRDAAGRVIGIIGASLDITARKAAERRLAELNATLEQRVHERTAELAAARDLAEAASHAKGEFLANMSHEIRTPLHGMLGMAQRLLAAPLPPEERRQAQIIERSGRLLLGVIDDVLDFSRIEAGRLEIERVPFDLVQLVRDAITLFESPAHAKGLSLSLSMTMQPDLGHAWVLGDPLRLAQILNNLLSNALKFTPAGGVEVMLAALGGQRWRLAVCDTGIGLDAAQRRRIFEPFLQADGSITRRFGGTGLGLAIVRRLVQLQGGELGVDSEPGRGADFWFELELPPAQPPAEAPGAMNTEADSLNGRHVLVAEDNEVNMEVARAMLQSLGVGLSHAGNGWQAVQAFEAARPELVLMDVHMPEMDGLEATRQIRALEAERGWERTPIVALTASALHEDRQRCLDAGMDDVLVKPFRLQQLQRVLEQRLR